MNEEQRKRLMADIEWTRGNIAGLDRDRRRVPWLFLLAFFAIPIGIKWGALAALATVGFSVFFAVAGLYLISGHRAEYEEKIRDLEAELAKADDRKPK